ncbi:MAG: ABC transporter ATP-binding protein/permease [Clostridia bacterium]|nr:ABC transporter ATP-binding protein/permease [Clostridia bacterium]
MAEAVSELIIPLIVAEMIDNGIANSDKRYIVLLGIQMIILGSIGLALSITAQYFAADTAVSTVKRLRHDVYTKIMGMSYSDYDKIGSANLITRMTADMDSVQNGINLTLRLLLRSPFVVAGAVIMSFRVDRSASMTYAVIVPVLAVIIITAMILSVSLFGKVRARLDRVLISVREYLTGTRVIRAFNIEDRQVEEFRSLNNGLTALQKAAGAVSSAVNPLTSTVVNIGIAALIYSGAVRVNAGLLTTGAVVALYNYMSQILVELIKFANLINSIVKSLACAKRISGVLSTEEHKPNTNETASAEGYINFKDVSFAYDGSSEYSVENISFEVGKNETVGIIGSTGSGKTTLMNLLCGNYKPEKGSISIDGASVFSAGFEKIKNRIAYVEQKPLLFTGTVRSNLTMGKEDISDEDIVKALRAAQAYEFVSERDGGIDCEVLQGGKNFSGGQRQRLAVARALCSKPDILILDDASSALDYYTDAKMRDAISEYGNSTVFIVSQRTSSILSADKIIVLENGKMEIGTHSELLKSSPVYREIHYSQFEEDEAI